MGGMISEKYSVIQCLMTFIISENICIYTMVVNTSTNNALTTLFVEQEL